MVNRRNRKKGGGGNAHQRAIARATQPPPKKISLPADDVIADEPNKNRLTLFLTFLEHPWVLGIFGILGGIVGMVYPVALFISVACIVGAFHRTKVVADLNPEKRWGAYLLVTVVGASLVFEAFSAVRRGAHIPTAVEIARAVKDQGNGVDAQFGADSLVDQKGKEAIAQQVAKEVSKLLSAEILHENSSLKPAIATHKGDLTYIPKVPPPSEGFVQFEGNFSLLAKNQAEVDNWVPGRILRLNYTYANRGVRPVFNLRSFGLFLVLDPAKNQGNRIQEMNDKSIKNWYKVLPGATNELGIGQSAYSTAVSNSPITADEIQAIQSGRLRIMLIMGAGWMDSTGAIYTLSQCEWTDWGELRSGSPTLFAQAVWHNC